MIIGPQYYNWSSLQKPDIYTTFRRQALVISRLELAFDLLGIVKQEDGIEEVHEENGRQIMYSVEVPAENPILCQVEDKGKQ